MSISATNGTEYSTCIFSHDKKATPNCKMGEAHHCILTRSNHQHLFKVIEGSRPRYLAAATSHLVLVRMSFLNCNVQIKLEIYHTVCFSAMINYNLAVYVLLIYAIIRSVLNVKDFHQKGQSLFAGCNVEGRRISPRRANACLCEEKMLPKGQGLQANLPFPSLQIFLKKCKHSFCKLC